MTTVTVSGTVSGYALNSPVTVLSIAAGGYVEGAGVAGAPSGVYTVANYGRVSGGFTGVYLQDGGIVTNGSDTGETALIKGGDYAIRIEHGPGVVINYGTILGTDNTTDFGSGGVAADYGTVTNGSPVDSAARIEGETGVDLADSLTNFGTIQGFFDGADAIDSITNGAASESGALIVGANFGVDDFFSLAITNFGTVDGVLGSGIEAHDGGGITNGGAGDGVALIEGYSGVYAHASATVTNFGTIRGAGAALHDAGIYLADGGLVANGSAGDKTALIEGRDGIECEGVAVATVTNLGTISGVGDSHYDAGVYLGQGGSVINGGAGDHSALISGYAGVLVSNASARVANFGTIEATNSAGPGGAGSYDAVSLGDGGSVTNGAVNDPTALISGYAGLFFLGSGASTNFGVIQATGETFGNGVTLGGGADLTNGAANDRSALIEGYTGAWLLDFDTLINFGTIEGVGGEAVTFTNPGELVVEAGSSFIGSVNGGASVLDLASGIGTIVLAGSVLTVSGSMAATPFTDFDTVRIAAGASFQVSGNNTGTLVVLGGTLTSNGAVSGGGHLNINGGIADMGAGFKENVFFTGTTGELELGSSKTYTGKITGFSKTGTTSLDLLDIAFAGTTTGVYTGTTTSGVLTVTEGARVATIHLVGDYLGSTFTLSAGPGGVGTQIIDPARASPSAAPTTTHPFIAAMAGFGASAGGWVGMGRESWPPPPPMLVGSRALA